MSAIPVLSPPLVSHSLPLCVPVFGWYDPLSPSVLPTYVPALDFRGLASACLSFVSPQVRLSWMVCPLSRGLVSHGLPSCVPLLDGMPAFPSCLPLFPMSPTASNCLSLSPHMRVRLPKVLSPLVSLLVSLCWMVRLALDYLPLSPFLFPCVGWCAFPRTCPPCPPACLPSCLPACQVFFPSCSLWCPPSSLFPFLFPFLGWCARLPEALSPSLSPSWSLFLFPFVGWCVRLPEALSLLSLAYLPACLPSCFPLLGGVSVFPLSPTVSLLFSLFWMVCPPSRVLVPFVSQLVCQFVFLFVSLCWRVRPPSYGVVSFVSQLSPSLSPSLSSSLFPACPPACLPVCLPACLSLVPQLKLSHAENCADSNVHRAPGLKMMCHLSLSSFDVFNTSNLTVLCCLLRAFGTKYLHPHRMLPSSFFGI